MARAGRTCTSCPALIPPGTSRCPTCQAKYRAASDQRRGPTRTNYGTAGHRAFRTAVLTRDPICVLCRTAWATVADHYPYSRRELIDRGLDPDDPKHGRGLCKRDHDRHTAQAQPGGWNVRKGWG